MDARLGTDFKTIAPRLGGGYPLYNCLAHLDNVTGKTEVYFPGKMHMVQEPVFIPRRGVEEEEEVEGDGFLLVLVNNYESMGSELHLIDTRDFTRARAVVLLPVRLRPGLHGNWVDALEVKSC
jgi:carotenoid cleavage dioxygenase